MKRIKARIPVGRTVFIREIDLYTIDEAKEILSNRDWEIGEDIFSLATNLRIGWLASFGNGDGIYVEAKE